MVASLGYNVIRCAALVVIYGIKGLNFNIVVKMFLLPFLCSFPADENLVLKWREAVGAERVNKRSRLCSNHFSDESFCEVSSVKFWIFKIKFNN